MRPGYGKKPLQMAIFAILAFLPLFCGGHPLWAQLLITAAAGLLCLSFFLSGLWQRSLFIIWSPQDFVLLLILGWAGISLAHSLSPPDAFFHLGIIFSAVTFFLLIRRLGALDLSVPLVFGMGTIGAAVSLFGLFQLAGLLPHGGWNPKGFMAATFVNHNHLAAYLEVLFPVILGFCFFAPVSFLSRLWAAICSVLTGIALILSCSRGAWISLALAAGAGLFFFGKRIAGKKVLVLQMIGMAATVGAGVLAWASRHQIPSRMQSLTHVSGDASFQTRLAIWQGTGHLISKTFLLGNGLGSFVYAFPRYRPEGLHWLVEYAHNEYFHLVAELGLPGLVLIFCFGLFIYRKLLKLIRRGKTTWEKAFGFGAWVGITAFLIHSTIDFPWHVPASAFQFLAVAGLVEGVPLGQDPDGLRHFGVKTNFLRGWQRGLMTALVIVLASFALEFWGQWVFADLQAYRGSLENAANHFEQAAGFYEQAARKMPFRAEYFRKLGEQLAGRAWQIDGPGHYDFLKKAAGAYRRALNLTSHDTRSAYALGSISLKLGDIPGADHWLSQAAADDPQNPLVWKELGELNLAKGRSQEAADAFRRAKSLATNDYHLSHALRNLDDPGFFAERGEGALKSNQLELSRTLFETALVWDPPYARARTGLAMIAIKRRDFERGEKEIQAVSGPDFRADWFAVLAGEYLKRGLIQDADAALAKSLALNPKGIWAHQIRMLFLNNKKESGKYAEAERQLLALNRPPVFAISNSYHRFQVTCDTEKGAYPSGNRRWREGWILSHNGGIAESFALPPGKARFQIRVRGTRAAGRGPMMVVSWSGQKMLSMELPTEEWTLLEIPIPVEPGESRMKIEFMNDFLDPSTGRDRNLIIGKITVTGDSN